MVNSVANMEPVSFWGMSHWMYRDGFANDVFQGMSVATINQIGKYSCKWLIMF